MDEGIITEQLLGSKSLKTWLQLVVEPGGTVAILGMYQSITYDKNGRMVDIRVDTTGVKVRV